MCAPAPVSAPENQIPRLLPYFYALFVGLSSTLPRILNTPCRRFEKTKVMPELTFGEEGYLKTQPPSGYHLFTIATIERGPRFRFILFSPNEPSPPPESSPDPKPPNRFPPQFDFYALFYVRFKSPPSNLT